MSVFKSEEGRKIVQAAYESFLTNWPVEHERRQVKTKIGEAVVLTHVVLCGPAEAPPLLLLHGTMSNSAAWMGDVGRWSNFFRVIAADMPGEPGLSEDRRLQVKGNDYSFWLDSLLNELGYQDEAVSVVGQSLGAFAALKFAISEPIRVKKLSMLTTSGVASARISFLFKALPLILLGKWGARRLNRMIAYGVDIGDDASSFGELVSKHCRTMNDPLPLFSDEELRRLSMPVQFFGGDHDILLNTEATSVRLQQLVPGIELNILEGAGHVVIGLTEEILRFMKDN